MLNVDGGDVVVLKFGGFWGCIRCCCRGICGCLCLGFMWRCGIYMGFVVVIIVGVLGWNGVGFM